MSETVAEFKARLVKAIELNDYGLYEMYGYPDPEKDFPILTISSILKFVKDFE